MSGPEILGRCAGCGQPKRLAQLTLVFGTVTPRPQGREWGGRALLALLCGPCLVDGLTPEVAA